MMETFKAPISTASNAHGTALQKNNSNTNESGITQVENRANKLILYADEILNCFLKCQVWKFHSFG